MKSYQNFPKILSDRPAAYRNIKVTVGSWSYQASSNNNGYTNIWSDSALIAAGGLSNGVLDYYQIHFYNNMGGTMSPIQNVMPFWQAFDKPHVIGEIPSDPYPYAISSAQSGSFFYEKLLQNCYAGVWGWYVRFNYVF